MTIQKYIDKVKEIEKKLIDNDEERAEKKHDSYHYNLKALKLFLTKPYFVSNKYKGTTILEKNLEFPIIIRYGRLIIPREHVLEFLKQLYKDPEFGFRGRDAMYNKLKDLTYGISRRDISNMLGHSETHQVHQQRNTQKTVKPLLIKKPYNHIQIDLIDVSGIRGFNNQYTFILNAIDLFSKYAWSEPITKKTDVKTLEAFKKILSQMKTTPKVIQSDRGPEFLNNKFKQFLKDNEITQITSQAYTPQSQGAIEKFNGTIKRMLQRYFTENNTSNYLEVLNKIVQNYNQTHHSTTTKKPSMLNHRPELLDEERKEAAYQNTKEKAEKMIGHDESKFPEIKRGDFVRLSLTVFPSIRKQTFRKSYLQQWTKEIYKVRLKTRGSHRTLPRFFIYDPDNELPKKIFKRDELLLVRDKDKIIHSDKQNDNKNTADLIDEQEEVADEIQTRQEQVKEVEKRERSKRKRRKPRRFWDEDEPEPIPEIPAEIPAEKPKEQSKPIRKSRRKKKPIKEWWKT